MMPMKGKKSPSVSFERWRVNVPRSGTVRRIGPKTVLSQCGMTR